MHSLGYNDIQVMKPFGINIEMEVRGCNDLMTDQITEAAKFGMILWILRMIVTDQITESANLGMIFWI